MQLYVLPKMGALILIIFVKLISAQTLNTFNTDAQKFPNSFKFGAATAAYQVEGGWNAEGKGASIWDDLTHKHPELIADGSNADVGPDSFHLSPIDIQAAVDLKLDFYRFSIAWSRILPTGDVSSLNSEGIRYYDLLITHLLANNIQPVVTMYHYDLPVDLQLLGGLTNLVFVQYFQDYANVLFENFGNRVKYWITFNEPADFCVNGYGNGIDAPLVKAHGIGEYLCGDNVLLAHASAYHLYQSKYKKKFGGKIGITLSSRFFYSENADAEALNRGMQFGLGWFANPLFSKAGGYPEVMINVIAENSIQEGRTWSRLPRWSKRKIKTVRGSADFLGLNYYTSSYVAFDNVSSHLNPSWDRDMGLKWYVDPNWKRAKSTWLFNVPQGIGDLLRWIKENYNNPLVLITENGWSDDGQLDDNDRILYLKDHLQEILKAISDDNCNVTAYTAWSLIDNFEWLRGYTESFGLYQVLVDDKQHKRTAKKSADYFKRVIETKSVPAV